MSTVKKLLENVKNIIARKNVKNSEVPRKEWKNKIIPWKSTKFQEKWKECEKQQLKNSKKCQRIFKISR